MSAKRVLVGTVGYQFLRDYSIGPKLLPALKALAWPPGVTVEEMSWGPVAVVFGLEAQRARREQFDRVVLLTATDAGLPPGAITLKRWRGGLPPPQQIQECINEAVTGVISAANLLVIGEHFGIWPDEVIVIDVQPGVEEAGEAFTPAVESAAPAVIDIVWRAATQPLASFGALADMRGDALPAPESAFTFSAYVGR